MAKTNSSAGGKMPASVAMDLAALVDYGEGAIVSRTLLENDAGVLTVFSFDAGQGLSEHTTPFDAVVEILDGQAQITIGGKQVQVASGQIILMPANVPHALQARVRFKMLLTMLRAQ